MISIVNYGSGNIRAIGNIYDQLKVAYNVVSSASELKRASHIILPGVGSFDKTLDKLNKSGLRQVLDEKALVEKIPVLGICVGMQIMANSSEEGVLPGLGWIKGDVKMFNKQLLVKPKLPHLGWNSILPQKESSILKGVECKTGFYFIHSYYYQTERSEDILTTTFYGSEFSSSINRGNIYGTQFHPEKSHSNGMIVLQNFAKL